MNDQQPAGLRFTWDWQAAPRVRTPELAATWSRLMISVDDVVATLVEEREASHVVRKTLDVPTYPLAEWLALNWWNLNAVSHRSTNGEVNLSGAADGFAWPDVSLRSDRGTVWAKVRRRDREPDYVRFLSEGRAILDSSNVTLEVGRFIDATARRLEESGISGTLLQDEWTAIQGADSEEVEFCRVAAAWGLDPYNAPPEDAALLISAGAALGDAELLANLASAVDLADLPAAEAWFASAAKAARLGRSIASSARSALPGAAYARPWLKGYDRARSLRHELGLHPVEPIRVEDLVGLTNLTETPPERVVGLVKIRDDAAGVVLPPLGAAPRRFAAARALGRMMTSQSSGLTVMTHSGRYLEQVERAFAAEFLAPAAGIEDMAHGNYSDESLARIAEAFEVSPLTIQHQVDNQLLAA